MRKQFFNHLVSLFIFSSLMVGYGLPASADASIPVAAFFKRPDFASPMLSPDGNNLAVLVPIQNRKALLVINLETRKSKVVASDSEADVRAGFQWINNSRIIFSTSKGKDATFAENSQAGGMFAVNKDGSNFRKLIPTIKEANSGQVAYKPFQFIARVEGDSDEIYVQSNTRGRDEIVGATDVLRLNTTTGRSKLLTFNNPGKVSQWVLDHDGNIRIASALKFDQENSTLQQTIYYRDDNSQMWKPIYKANLEKGREVNFLGFDFTNKNLFVSGRFGGRDKAAVYAWDFAKNDVGEMIVEDSLVDVNAHLIKDNVRKKLIGLSYDGMLPEVVFFDKEIADIYASLKAQFPGKQINVQIAGQKALVTVYSSDFMGASYLYDFDKQALEFIFSASSALDGKRLSAQKPIQYTARDGLHIPAYLTLPEGKESKDLPLVVYVHGGPHSRDEYGYDPLTQLLSSRGFAVLQPQFRMSIGFGWQHHVLGWKQWGLAMQDDVTDGVNYLISKGIVNPKRVCIMGASYGGYAAMYGLIKDPDLYQCGINFVGVTDIGMMSSVAWSDISDPLSQALIKTMHGDPDKDKDYVRNSSAILNASKIKAPTLLAYGSEDVRVPLIHGEKMRDQLKAQGNDLQWKVFVGEGHGWYKESNNVLWGEMVLDFVMKHIGDK